MGVILVLDLPNSGHDHTLALTVLQKMIHDPDLTQMVLYLHVQNLYLLYLRLGLCRKGHLVPGPDPGPGDMSAVVAEEPQEVSVAVQ